MTHQYHSYYRTLWLKRFKRHIVAIDYDRGYYALAITVGIGGYVKLQFGPFGFVILKR